MLCSTELSSCMSFWWLPASANSAVISLFLVSLFSETPNPRTRTFRYYAALVLKEPMASSSPRYRLSCCCCNPIDVTWRQQVRIQKHPRIECKLFINNCITLGCETYIHSSATLPPLPPPSHPQPSQPGQSQPCPSPRMQRSHFIFFLILPSIIHGKLCTRIVV